PAHSDLGVGQHAHGGSAELSPVVKKVEATHLVRAVVGAVPRAHAAVVDHVVQSLGAVHRGAGGADELARRVLAMHAGNRLVIGPRIGRVAFEVAVHADPVHGVPAAGLALADGRNVV